ncbi:MAG: glycosyltransferase, partial [Planctomycetia bacterium]|nr:glycosyltransferase [Planctomycetia bacterium]
GRDVPTGGLRSASHPLGAGLTGLGERVRHVSWCVSGERCVPVEGGATAGVPVHDRVEHHWLIVPDPLALSAAGVPVAGIIRWAREHGLRTGFVLPNPGSGEPFAGTADRSADVLRPLLLADGVWTDTRDAADELTGWWRRELLADAATMPRVTPLHAAGVADGCGAAVGPWERHARAISRGLSSLVGPRPACGPIYYCIDATLDFRGNTGIQRVARQLARGLLDLSVELVPFRWDESTRRMAAVDPAGLERFAAWNGPAAASWAAWREPERSAAGGWMLVPELPLNRPAGERRRLLVRARGAGLRCGIVFFDAIPWKMRDLYPTRFAAEHRAYMRELADYDLVLPISDHSRQDLVDFLSAAAPRPVGLEQLVRTAVLPGEFPECPRVVETPSASLGCEAATILCVGTVEPRKNHETLLAAFALAADRSRVPLRLVIAGSDRGFDRALSARADALVRGRTDVEWIRDADDVRLRGLYAACDFTIYPSFEEGFGLPILESLWHGRPCLCASFGAMRQVAEGGGCVTTDVRCVEKLAAAIVQLAEDPGLRRRLSAEAVGRRFKTWRHYAADVLHHLNEAAGPPPVPECPPRPQGPSAVGAVEPIPSRPRLSVCISTYNRAGWLEAALTNWARLHPQPLPGVELVVCDNASTDDTAAVVQRHAGRGDLVYHRNGSNVGMLGNLRETAQRARGDHVWIVGDDDIVMPGCVERILGVLREHPAVPLVYLNYAFTRLDEPEKIRDFAAFFSGSRPIVAAEADRRGPIRTICARNENFFTAIYTCVFRRDHALRAYCRDTSGRPFSSLATCVPTTCHVLEEMMDQAGYWVGQPQVVVNMNVSWSRYAPLWILERIPEIYDRAERRGAAPDEVDRWRRHTLGSVPKFMADILENDAAGNAPFFQAERLVRRFGHLAEFDDVRETLAEIYARAWERGHPRARRHPTDVFGVTRPGWSQAPPRLEAA